MITVAVPVCNKSRSSVQVKSCSTTVAGGCASANGASRSKMAHAQARRSEIGMKSRKKWIRVDSACRRSSTGHSINQPDERPGRGSSANCKKTPGPTTKERHFKPLRTENIMKFAHADLTLCLSTAFSLAVAGQIVPYNQQTFDHLTADGKPVVLDISATWCPTCKAQKPIVENIMKQPAFSDVTLMRIDFDSQKPL